MRVYLAGPMTGHPDHNAAGFAAAEDYALAQGWEIASPRRTDPAHDGPCPAGEPHTAAAGSHPYPCWLKASLRMMLDCDAVLMLPGWQHSHGARLERTVAEACGVPVDEMAAAT